MKWELERIEKAFSKLKLVGWDMNSPMKWGFTFLAKKKEELEKIYLELKDYNYLIEELKYREDLTLWLLYITKIETLKEEKLHRRNLSFEELTIVFDIESYDGWDVSRINK